MPWVAAAIVVGAGVNAYSASKSAEAQADALAEAGDTEYAMYQQTRADQEPWRVAGENALARIEETPDFEFTADTFEQFKDPSYDWRVSEGVNAIDSSASARGNMFSGGQSKALMEYGQNMGSQEYQNSFNRAKTTYDTNMNTDKSLAGVGQEATNQLQQANTSYANQSSQNSIASGQVQADMYANTAQSVNQGIGNYMLYDSLK